jgi:hypothetical protein
MRFTLLNLLLRLVLLLLLLQLDVSLISGITTIDEEEAEDVNDTTLRSIGISSSSSRSSSSNGIGIGVGIGSRGERCGGPLLFVFGDSMVDTGEYSAAQPLSSAADFPPYGLDYFPSPAARWSNGRVISDFVGKDALTS